MTLVLRLWFYELVYTIFLMNDLLFPWTCISILQRNVSMLVPYKIYII